MAYRIDVKAQHFLDEHLAPEKHYLLFETCTTAEQANFFRNYLLGHLIDTARLLATWGCEQELCDAGLFHSLYSTESIVVAGLPFTPLPLERRAEVRSMLGSRTERIVYLFCAMKRDAFFVHEAKSSAYAVFDRFTHVEVPLSRQEFLDVLTLMLADRLEPVVGKQADPRVEAWVKASYKEEFLQVANLLPPQAVQDFRLAYDIEEEGL